jgi:hypothetical protein
MKSLSLLIKPASGLCNLRCRYCFYHDLKQHGAGNFGLMSRETMETLVRRALGEEFTHVSFNLAVSLSTNSVASRNKPLFGDAGAGGLDALQHTAHVEDRLIRFLDRMLIDVPI